MVRSGVGLQDPLGPYEPVGVRELVFAAHRRGVESRGSADDRAPRGRRDADGGPRASVLVDGPHGARRRQQPVADRGRRSLVGDRENVIIEPTPLGHDLGQATAARAVADHVEHDPARHRDGLPGVTRPAAEHHRRVQPVAVEGAEAIDIGCPDAHVIDAAQPANRGPLR